MDPSTSSLRGRHQGRPRRGPTAQPAGRATAPAQRPHPPAPAAPRATGSDPLPSSELLRRIEFKVLRRLDGFLFGDVTGVFYGPSLDLAEVREYQPGDEVRRIDWNVTARTGKIHVRQYREEREIRAWLLVDRSPSMSFGTRRGLKSQVARDFAVTAASVLTRQGNKVGCLAFGSGGARMLRPASGRQQVLRVLESLGDRPGGRPPATRAAAAGDAGHDSLAAALGRLSRTIRGRSLVLLVSDFLTSGEVDPSRDPAWAHQLGRLAARHDVIAVRVSDPAEHRLPDVGDLRVRDPETGQELWIDTGDPQVQRAHAHLVETRERTLTRSLRSSGADLLQLSTDHDLVRPLLAFVRRRKARRQEAARS